MAGLVAYSSSSEDESTTPPAKKRKLSTNSEKSEELPPLPAAFLDQYSSTVRTSAQDDPSLHGGRKRVTPHVQGNWPTHVYLEWHPTVAEAKVLNDVTSAIRKPQTKTEKVNETESQESQRESVDNRIHSLLEDELGVALPLHISLSRPLALRTEQKDAFLSRLRKAIGDSTVKAFQVQPKDPAWHSNEKSTRWFLVLRLQHSANEEITQLLDTCNDVANDFGQPLLYASKDKRGRVQAASKVEEKFHVSVAWSLEGPHPDAQGVRRRSVEAEEDGSVPYELLARLTELNIGFREVKVRIGQDVHTMPLKAARRMT